MDNKNINFAELGAALTIVIDNDIVVLECDVEHTILDIRPRVIGYKWKYKNAIVWVKLSEIVNATILTHGGLDSNVDRIRLLVKHKLYEMINKEGTNDKHRGTIQTRL